ncbi:MAG: polysaccharide lyase [Planctomycetota bacterium]
MGYKPLSWSLHSIAIALAFVALAVITQPAYAIVIYENDFEDDPVGVYTTGNLAADWHSPPWSNGVSEGRVSITDDADAYGSKSLVVTYPEGQSASGKSQWWLEFDQGYEELFLSYRLRFDEGFNYVLGGKLPGLCGGACNTGGDKPTGYDGWSARMMWRTGNWSATPGGSDKGDIVQYVYHPDQPTQFGEDLRWDDGATPGWREFEPDRWYHLQHRVVMNTPGIADGVIQGWLDGELVLDVQDIRFREISSIQIDAMNFSTFFGGNSEIWEAVKDEQAYFDDFVVSTAFIPTGDYNRDGVVDVADYTVWRDAYGSTTSLAADGNGDGAVDIDDYLLWNEAFTGTSSAASVSAFAAVPEPALGPLLIAAIAATCSLTTRREASRR